MQVIDSCLLFQLRIGALNDDDEGCPSEQETSIGVRQEAQVILLFNCIQKLEDQQYNTDPHLLC